jgi:hypothetical protein
MLDATIQTVPGWQRGLIARPGRLAVVKAMSDGCSSYSHLLILEAAGWLLEDAEKAMRGFFWAGKKRANGGHYRIVA